MSAITWTIVDETAYGARDNAWFVADLRPPMQGPALLTLEEQVSSRRRSRAVQVALATTEVTR